MSVEDSLSRLSSALKKLEKANAQKPKQNNRHPSLAGQQDLFSSGSLSADQSKELLQKIDHTIATVEMMIQQERA